MVGRCYVYESLKSRSCKHIPMNVDKLIERIRRRGKELDCRELELELEDRDDPLGTTIDTVRVLRGKAKIEEVYTHVGSNSVRRTVKVEPGSDTVLIERSKEEEYGTGDIYITKIYYLFEEGKWKSYSLRKTI